MSARESYCFMKYFTIFVGNKVPKNDLCWKYVLCLYDLVEFLLKDSFSKTDIIALREMIKIHHNKYINCFGTNLRPKHHFLCHYPRIIEYSGPLKPLSCMRMESKNKQVKEYSKVCNSRINLPLSLSKKCCYSFALDIITSHPFQNDIEVIKTKTMRTTNCNYAYYSNLNMDRYLRNNVLHLLSVVRYKGTLFKSGFYIYESSKLYLIQDMLLYESKLLLILLETEVLCFDSNLKIYKTGKTTGEHFLKNIDTLVTKKPFELHVMSNGSKYFLPRTF